MKTKHYFLTLLLTASFSALFGQRNRVDYDRDTKWNFGLNAGGTWQEKELDFVNYPGFSGGLTLGRSIYEKEGRLLSFDLRGRLLAGQTSGWSTVPSYDSTLFSNHPDGVGYKNYRFEYGEGSLELVVNAHRLRERTGILLYGFGGVGLVSHSIKHNYKDGADWYDYSLVDSTANKDLVAFNLKSFFNDKKWETDNAFFSGNQTLVMPSLGLGLGYQVTPQFSLGVEHKVTFGLNDNLDGYIDGKNDRYHYTNFNLRWNLFRGNGTGNGSYIPEERPLPNQGGNPNPSSNGNVDDYSTNPSTDVPQGNKPLVNITRPASNGGSVYTMNYNVKAKVYYVDGRNDIVFKHNGVIVNSFNYSPSSKVLEVNVILTPGANTFVVTGTNAYGSDTDTKTINYNKICNKPTITYTQPLNNGKVISVASTTIKAKILNVSNRNMLVFKHNGVMNNNFTFNTSTKAFVATVNCVEGSNVFEIEARNECGEKSNSRTIVFNEPIKNTPPPIVTITNPNTSPYTTTASSYNLGATVLYVDGASQIQFKLNGVATNAFSYNVNTKVLNASINLQNGNNVVEIKATNPYGMDTKTTVIVRKQLEQTPPPVVTISYPATSPYSVSVNNSVVNGMVYNVNSSSQIQVTVNGMLLNNFVYNTSTKKISFTANLNLGSNVVSITATNIAGVDTKSTTIVYKKPVAMLPPVVSFINPMVSPYTVSMSNFTVKAKVLNVTSANQITVTHNGTVIPASFNNSTKEVIINQ
ncbi:MAG: hypothetical protein N4A35_12615, partial [Flavobacteriales bacterium]|nr:hypothetical protein [Flavobacteriales bacterium]